MSLRAFPRNSQWLMAPTWRSAAECSTIRKWRLEKLDCRWSNDGCVGRQAMTMKQSGDADGPRQQMTGGIPQLGTMEPSSVDVCTPGRPVW